MRYVQCLLALLIGVSPAWPQSSFVAPDGAMAPTLASGSTYEVNEPFQGVFLRHRIVVFTRQGQLHVRRVVGLPGEKLLSQDPDFAIRSRATWGGQFNIYRAWCWLRGDHPAVAPSRTSHLVTADVLLDVSFDAYEAASALGDSLYYVHALNRPDIAQGQERTAAQGADSREWGAIHARDFVGVIEP